VIAPWLKANVMLRDEPQHGSSVTAQLQPNVRVRLLSCSGSWCHVSTQEESATGYVRQQKIWGAYPGESFG
jgi:SH3-like domain-containing protein